MKVENNMGITKQIETLTADDINTLIEDKVSEGKGLEYKAMLPGNSDKERKEFLADVSSFANSSGGVILYGISDQRDDAGKTTGVPEKIVGLADFQFERDTTRLIQILNSGVQPRISNIHMHPVRCENNLMVLAVRIPKSFSAPHMIVFQDYSRFYSRTGAGKYLLDVFELKQTFLSSDQVFQRAKGFQSERLAGLLDKDNALLAEGARFVLHVLPLSFIASNEVFDVTRIKQHQTSLAPIEGSSSVLRYNLDGVIVGSDVHRSHQIDNYLQFFRNCAIESVRIYLQFGSERIIPSLLEKETVTAVARYLNVYRSEEIPPPFVILMSIVLGDGWIYAIGPSPSLSYHINKDLVKLPDILITDYQDRYDSLLKPAFDVLWQAGGYPGSENFDEGS